MKKLLLMILAICVGFSSCVKDDVSDKVMLPLISEIIFTPKAPTATDNVVVTAKVAVAIGTIDKVTIEWSLDGTPQTAIAMSVASGVYSGTIPAQANNVKVSFKISATNGEGVVILSAASQYTVGAAAVGTQADIRLNEINGMGVDADKYIELYNSTANDVNLEGMTITYGGVTSWTGVASYSIPAKGYFVIQGAKGTATLHGGLSTGLSAGKGIHVLLMTVTGSQADAFLRGTAQDAALTGTVSMDYSRIPDGTGEWYLTAIAGTKGVTNGTSTVDLEKVSELQ